MPSSVFLIRSRQAMARNGPEGTGPMHVPFGHIVANQKWRGSQLVQGMQGQWAALCKRPLLNFLKTFYLLSPFTQRSRNSFFLSVF